MSKHLRKLKRQIVKTRKKTAPPTSQWKPLPDPPDGRVHPQRQTLDVWKSPDGPDEIFYGGSSGGGKSAMAVGMSLTEHYRTLILRREGSQLEELINQLKDFAPPGSHWRGIGNGGKMTTSDGRTIQLAGVPHEDSKRKYQGRPNSMLAIDECTEIPESTIDYLRVWIRTTRPEQRTLLLLLGNPPTHANGAWIVRRYAPWLDPRHPNPAKPGDVRYFVRNPKTDREIEVPGKSPVSFDGKTVVPSGRTFIPARLRDNPMLDAGYEDRLSLLPGVLQRAFRDGDFSACLQDAEWGVIPMSWILAAQERWRPDGGIGIPLSKVGLDLAYGGEDSTVLTLRHGNWIAPQQAWQGPETDSGEKAANLVIPFIPGYKGEVNYDIIGYGAAAGEALKRKGFKVEPVNFGKSAENRTDARGVLTFTKIRSLAYWKLRDMLDPQLGFNLALPPEDVCPGLLAELAAHRYQYMNGRIHVLSKDEVKAELGRSPDRADSVVLACYDTPTAKFQFYNL